MRDDFAVFILTHGRADNVVTVRTLAAQGFIVSGQAIGPVIGWGKYGKCYHVSQRFLYFRYMPSRTMVRSRPTIFLTLFTIFTRGWMS